MTTKQQIENLKQEKQCIDMLFKQGEFNPVDYYQIIDCIAEEIKKLRRMQMIELYS